jgi:hypothetical protein
MIILGRGKNKKPRAWALCCLLSSIFHNDLHVFIGECKPGETKSRLQSSQRPRSRLCWPYSILDGSALTIDLERTSSFWHTTGDPIVLPTLDGNLKNCTTTTTVSLSCHKNSNIYKVSLSPFPPQHSKN